MYTPVNDYVEAYSLGIEPTVEIKNEKSTFVFLVSRKISQNLVFFCEWIEKCSIGYCMKVLQKNFIP